MASRKIHYLREIRGGYGTWIHCGRIRNTCQGTRILADVTCQQCRAYILQGSAYGYTQSSTAAGTVTGGAGRGAPASREERVGCHGAVPTIP